jgi:hypothetical protein
VYVRIPRRQNHGKVFYGGVPHPYVFCHGVFKERNLLVNHGNGAAERIFVNLRTFFAVEGNLPLPRFVQPRNQLGKGRLPRPGRAYNGNGFARLQIQGKIFNQRRGKLVVTKGNIVDFYRTRQLARQDAAAGVKIRLPFIIHYVFNTFHIRPHGGETAHHTRKLAHRGKERTQKTLERHQHPNGHIPVHNKHHAKHHHRQVKDLPDN